MALAFVATCGGGPEPKPVAAPAPLIAEQPLQATASPHVTAAPTLAITARVLENGEPVADSAVSISDGSKPLLSTALTDRDGFVRFKDLEPGAYELWAAHDQAASAIARVMEVKPGSTIDIVLDRPASALHGQLQADGPLPPGATLRLVPLDLDQAIRIASVGERGRFELAALPYGRWRIDVSAPGFVQVAEQTVAIGASPEELVVRLQRTGSVVGTVVDPLGAPVANATIVLRDDAGNSLREPMSLVESRLRWVHPLAGPTRVVPPNALTVFGAPRAGSRPAECGRGHCGIDLVQPRGSVIHAVADGRIATLFPEAKTEAGRVVVVAHGGGLKSFYMHLDELRPGLEVGQWIHAGDPVGTLGSTGFTHSVPHLHFAITHEEGGRTWYLDPEPMIRSAVVLPTPRPFDPVDGNALAPRLDLPAPEVTQIKTDANGVFRIRELAPGGYVAAAFAESFAPGVSSPFTLGSGQEVTGITIRISEGVVVHGRVTGRDGPIADATVIATTGMGEGAHKFATTRTDKYGEYTLRSIGGTVTLGVSVLGYGETERAIRIVENREQPREDFMLTVEDGQLTGVVLAPDGGAASGIGVRIVEGVTRRRTVSDAFGHFTIAPVASGHYVVEISALSYPPKRIAIDTAKWTELRLDAGGGTRTVIRDAHSGAPMPGVRIQATSAGGQTITRSTDARGLVELRGLAAGDWTLAVHAPGYIEATRSISVHVGHALTDTVIDLVRGATLAGEVRDHFGRRVAGARVSIGNISTVTDADGAFLLRGAESGTLEADSDGHHGTLGLRLAPGEGRLSLTIDLGE